MKKIKILGTGCAKCTKLMENAEKAAKKLGIEYEIEKVSDINAIMSYGVMATPALVLDDKVKVVGKVPSQEDIEKILK
ncbi:MAG TPA: thioredoxin family protein [Syntrophorhabdus sp.]|nr:thioredoxin family protein [Syntrophorhabdus sp.]